MQTYIDITNNVGVMSSRKVLRSTQINIFPFDQEYRRKSVDFWKYLLSPYGIHRCSVKFAGVLQVLLAAEHVQKCFCCHRNLVARGISTFSILRYSPSIKVLIALSMLEQSVSFFPYTILMVILFCYISLLCLPTQEN